MSVGAWIIIGSVSAVAILGSLVLWALFRRSKDGTNWDQDERLDEIEGRG